MSSGVTLAAVKGHLRITADDHDGSLQTYISAAETFLGGYLRRDMSEDFPTAWPADLQACVLDLVEVWFDGGSDDQPMPMRVKLLAASYRNLG